MSTKIITKSAVSYLRECFTADHSSHKVEDVFSTKTQHLLVSKLCCDAISPSYGSKVLPVIESYRREKVFRHYTYFIVGREKVNRYGKNKSLTFCAPLFIYDAAIIRNAERGSDYDYSKVIEQSSLTINDPLLNIWQEDRALQDTLADKLQLIVEQDMDKSSAQQTSEKILAALVESNPEVRVSLKPCFFDNKASFNKAFKNINTGEHYLVALQACALVERSPSTRGILDELSNLINSEQYSACLNSSLSSFFDKDSIDNITAIKPANYQHIPGFLSKAQKQALDCAAESTLSLLIGPPGTGKSYTIACVALERFMQGETVLIVSKNEHAIDVVKEKITDTFGLSHSSIMRAGTKGYHKELKQHLDCILQRNSCSGTHDSNNHELASLASLEIAIAQINKDIKAAERQLMERFRRAEKEGDLLHKIESNEVRFRWLNQCRLWLSQHYSYRQGLLQESLKNIQQLHKQREALLAKTIDKRAQDKITYTLHHHRRQLAGFNSAIRARTSTRQDKILSELDFSILLESMPIWLCSLEGLHKALPLTCELFDLVIIDEATQCDIASCLPALQRAKRAMVVGDPKQLRHISFLSKLRQNTIKLNYPDLEDVDINYRDHSLIDLALANIINQSSIVMLNEHYRSVPDIIRFSNEYFYDGKLRLMTDKPAIESRKSIEIVFTEQGKRIDGVNEQEAAAVINKIRELITEQLDILSEYKLSIGVLAFFRAQAEYIQDEIFKNFDLDEIMAHKLRCGTAYAFQGEERDVIILSCGVDQDSPAGSFNYINRPDVFNVAVTRARVLEFVYLSCPFDKLPETSLLKKFVNAAANIKAVSLQPEKDIAQDIQAFIRALREDSYQVLLSYPIAGIEIDMIIMQGDEVLAVDLIGFGGKGTDAFHLNRYQIFERAGLSIIPICITNWRWQPLSVMNSISESFKVLIDKNTLGKVQREKNIGLWMKLVADEPVLAEQTRIIEGLLVAFKAHEVLELLSDIIDQYQKVVWVLNERLEPQELTHIRYKNACEQVYLSVLDNMQQWLDVRRLAGLELTNEQQAVLESYMANIQHSLLSLQDMALKWGSTVTKSQLANLNITEALVELNSLTERIGDYADSSH